MDSHSNAALLLGIAPYLERHSTLTTLLSLDHTCGLWCLKHSDKPR